MRRPAPMTILCLAAALLAGCAGPVRRGPALGSRPATDVSVRLDQLEAMDDDAAILEAAAELRRVAHSSTQRARLELARARALGRQGRTWSSLSAYGSAWNEVPSVRGLGGDILLEWADAELAAGRVSDAVKHYQAALEDRRLPPERRRRLLASLVLACRAGGDEDGARRWAKELGDDAESQVASLALRLNRPSARSPGPVATAITAPPGTIPADPTALLPAIHRRYEWHARPIRSNHVPMTPVTSITVHHSDSPASFSPADQIHDIQRLHVVDFGWADIGYHLLIDAAGGIWEGRSMRHQGAHAGNPTANLGNIGICLLGDFEQGPVPRRQLESLLGVLDSLRLHFGLSRGRVRTHREWKNTLCPGRYLQPAVAAYRAGSGGSALSLATTARQ